MRRYEKEFQAQAIKMSDEIGQATTAEQLGINYGTLADWRKKRNQQNRKEVAKKVNTQPLSEREKQLNIKYAKYYKWKRRVTKPVPWHLFLVKIHNDKGTSKNSGVALPHDLL